ncbi:hypothetical protein N9399_04920 [Porticoccaceae bacterium]|nr:hypothetical protein [Porticoccaceae bacterium]
MDYQFRTFFEIAGTVVVVMLISALFSFVSGQTFSEGIDFFIEELKQPIEIIDLVLYGLVFYFYKGFCFKR